MRGPARRRPTGAEVTDTAGGGKSLPAQTVGTLSGATDQASRPGHPRYAGPLITVAGLASMLTVVQPDTLIRWHRQGWRLFWRCRPGRPLVPVDLQRLIVTMAGANPTWGEERIAAELLLKLGLTVSPRTVGRYLQRPRRSRGGRPSQRWTTFVQNHAHAVLACDFFTQRRC
jgi:hypothetical protein